MFTPEKTREEHHRRGIISKEERTVVKCFIAPVFMNEEHHTINLLLFVDHRMKTQLNNGLALRNLLCNYHDYDLASLVCGWMKRSGKKHLAFATTIKVIKMKINKFIALVLWWCLMNQSRFLLTLCILFFFFIWFCFVSCLLNDHCLSSLLFFVFFFLWRKLIKKL